MIEDFECEWTSVCVRLIQRPSQYCFLGSSAYAELGSISCYSDAFKVRDLANQRCRETGGDWCQSAESVIGVQWQNSNNNSSFRDVAYGNATYATFCESGSVLANVSWR